YFPISPHLTRIRVHKQNITPLREIVCYPMTTTYTNVPPVFSSYKRTAPSYAQVMPKNPPPQTLPPSPPKRLSSHHNSTLRLWSNMKSPSQTHTSSIRPRHESCFRDTNVSFLRDRLSHKLGMGTRDYGKASVRRTLSSSPVGAKTRTSLPSSTAMNRSRSAPDDISNKQKAKLPSSEHRSRRAQQEASRKLSKSPDLSAPLEVKKILQRQKEKDIRERLGSRYKALRVTVAISAKGRELLQPKTTATSSYSTTTITSSTAAHKKTSNSKSPTPSTSPISGSQRGPLNTESFFQHLLLRDMQSPTPSVASSLYRVHRSESTLGLLNVYLAQKRPVTDSKFRSLDRLRTMRSSSEPPVLSPTLETSTRSQSPSREHSPTLPRHRSPSSPTRSPACRKIRGTRSQTVKTVESIITDHSDYQTYVMELMHSTRKSDRYRELHKFYSSLERLGELERTTSVGDLRPRLKGEEIIDYDRWMQLRKKEKAEEEMKILYKKLKEDQKEKDLLFQPKDAESFRWKKERDRGLRCKEISVENLKYHFRKLGTEDSDLETIKRKEIDAKKDVYKPLWRGSSVLNLATCLATVTGSRRGRPVTDDRSDARGIGSRLWSSLSMDQVNALKSQLSEIYSTVSNLKRQKFMKKEDYEISVPPERGKSTKIPVRTASASETESASSDASTRTVIHKTNSKDDVLQKVKYFEKKQSSSSESTNFALPVSVASPPEIPPSPTKLHPSQSFSDLKELFGEQNRLRYATNRSVSPDPTKYWRAYLRMVKRGDVRRLRDKFENTNRVVVRGQEIGDVRRLRCHYEACNNRGRSRGRKSRALSPVPKIPFRAEDRFMPHINVISKTASLQSRSATVSPQRYTGITDDDSFSHLHTGEVQRIKEKFETQLSLMGQMFTSTPDIHELKDIAPYLGCHWVAHRYPETHPNSRSLSSPELRLSPPVPGHSSSLSRTSRPRPASSSPTRSHRHPLSILKPQQSVQQQHQFPATTVANCTITPGRDVNELGMQ
ncbi:hypothetical protein L9F63_019421, partial [Diploptera punctata]